MPDDIYTLFIDKLKKDKREKEAKNYLNSLTKISAVDLFTTLLSFMSEKDMEELEKMSDDDMKKEMERRFKEKTGIAPWEFVKGLQDRIAEEYLISET